MAFRIAVLPIMIGVPLLAGCGGEGLNFSGTPAANSPDIPPSTAAPLAKPPPVNLAGRWMFSATGTTSCMMTFGANAPDATEGSIAPGGGCPFNFFTSRKWSYTETGLTLRDHNAQALAQLAPATANRFEGTTNSGQDVALSRP
ncbi:MAG TPA: AprI/Inh family metalloprotease inhibitor [Bradyrhizobium sp.]|nr:AprI/Inh family metalloprotease inhibitor [Bradyrhizobium sp.]